MSYFNKYQKYKHKYLQLKTQTGGNLIYKIESINDNKIIIKLINEQERDNYILFLESNKVKIIYNNNNIFITIYLSNVIISGLVLDFSNVKIIDRITITYDKFHDTYENIEITKPIIEIFNFDIVQENSVFDTCIDFNKRFKYNDNLFGFKNIISSTVCNILFLRYNNSEITKYKNILLFIYEVMYFDMYNKINDENYKRYLNKLIKKTVPVYISPKFIEIKNKDCVFKPLSENKEHVWNIIIDTGNASYTKISTYFLNKILLCPELKCENFCLSASGVSSNFECNRIIKFQFKFYENIYEVIATVDEDEHSEDILFGHKLAINMFFKNDFSIDIDYFDTKQKKIDEISFRKFVIKFDNLLCCYYKEYLIESKNKLDDKIKTEFFSNNIIDEYLIYLILYICEYNIDIKNKKFIGTTDYKSIKNDFNNFVIDYEHSNKRKYYVDYIYGRFRDTYNFVRPMKSDNFYNYLSDNEMTKFMNEHYEVMLKKQRFINTLNEPKLKHDYKVQQFITLLTELVS